MKKKNILVYCGVSFQVAAVIIIRVEYDNIFSSVLSQEYFRGGRW